MSQLNKTNFGANYGSSGSQFPDNTTGLITELIMRTFGQDLLDSFASNVNDLQKKTTASGTNTYAITGGITSYVDGYSVIVKFTNASSGVSTLNVNSIGAKKIFVDATTQATTGDITALQTYLLVYDSALDAAVGGFALIGGSSGGGGSSAWGSITGTLSDQTDLQAALDSKEALYRTFDRKTGNYGLVLADATKGIEMNVAGANTVTVPLNATQAFTVGTLIPLVQYGAGLTSVVATGGVTINTSAGNLDSPGQYSPMFLRKIATDEWYLWNGTAGGGGGTWGSITGTLSDQTDLQAALDAKFTTADASETVKGIAELATQAETNTGTDDLKIVTPLKLLVKNRKEATKTSGYTVAQTDDQGFLIANSASAIAFDFPSLEAGTIVTIININSGDVTWTNSGSTSFTCGLTSLVGGTLASVTFRYRSTTVIEVLGGMPTQVESLTISGSLAVKAGASAGAMAKVGGTIAVDSTTTGNVTTGVDTIQTYSLAANTLNTDKDSIRGFVSGTFAANANNKQVIVSFGATTMFATGAVAFNTGDWRIDFEVVRTGAATQKISARWTSDNTSLDESYNYVTAAETLSGAITILVTGEGTGTNDIVKEMFKISFDPAP